MSTSSTTGKKGNDKMVRLEGLRDHPALDRVRGLEIGTARAYPGKTSGST